MARHEEPKLPKKKFEGLKSLKDALQHRELHPKPSKQPNTPKPKGPQLLPDISARERLHFGGEADGTDFFKPVAEEAANELYLDHLGSGRSDQKEVRDDHPDWSTSVAKLVPSSESPMGREVLNIELKGDKVALDAVCTLYGIKPHTEDWYGIYQDIAASYSHKDAVESLEKRLQKYPRILVWNERMRDAKKKVEAFIAQAKERAEQARRKLIGNNLEDERKFSQSPFKEIVKFFGVKPGYSRWLTWRTTVMASFRTKKGCDDLVTLFDDEVAKYTKRIQDEGKTPQPIPQSFYDFIEEAKRRRESEETS